MNDGWSFTEILEPAIKIARDGDHDMARLWFRMYADYLEGKGHDRPTAEKIVVDNLGYYAGYHDHETMEAVREVFGAVHPLLHHQDRFGRVSPYPTAGEAFEAGKRWAERMEET